MYLTVELLRAADGRLEGVVTTESGQQRMFSGTLDLLRILEDLQPPADPSPADPSSGAVPTPRRPR